MTNDYWINKMRGLVEQIRERKKPNKAKEEFIAAFSTKDNKDEILREAENIFGEKI